MFCKKCGNELSDNALFCPKCGAKIGEEADAAATEPTPAAAADPGAATPQPTVNYSSSDIAQTLLSGSSGINVIVFGAALVHLIQIILWYCHSFYVKVALFDLKETLSMHDACNGTHFICVITVLLLLASIALNVLKGINIDIKASNIICIVGQAWYLGWFLIEYIAGKNEFKDEYYSEMVKIGFTFAGVLMLLLSLACIAYYVLNIMQSKKNAAAVY